MDNNLKNSKKKTQQTEVQKKKRKKVTKIWNNTNIEEETRSMRLSQFIFVNEKLLIRSHQ